MAINPDKNAVEQGLIARLIGKIKRIALDMGDSVSAETTRATAAEAAAKTEVVQGENCSVTKTTASDGHDVYTVNADGKPQVQADWSQADSSAVDYIKNKPNLALKENVANKSQSIDPTSTTEYGSSKAVADFVNSSVATNTANFLGSFTLTDLSLTYPATDVQIAAALNSHTWPSGVTPTNNDYVYVEIQNPQTTGVDDEVERFKFSDMLESWGYEYTLNNSSFTPAEMATLESGITASDKAAWNSHVSNTSNPHGVTAAQVGAEPAFSVLPIDKGGTGKSTRKAATYNLFSDMGNIESDPDESSKIVFRYETPTEASGMFFSRPIGRLWNYIRGKILGWYDWTRVDSGTGRYAKICSIADPASGTSYTVDVLVTHMTSYYAVTGLVRITVSHGSSSVQASILASDSLFYAVDSGNPPKVYTYVDGNGKRTFVFDTASAYQTAQGFVFRAVGGFSDKWSFFGDVGCSNDAADLGGIGTKQDALDVAFGFATYAKTAGHAATATSAGSATEAASVPWSGVNARPSTMCSPYFDASTTGRYYKMLSTNGVQNGSSCHATLKNAFAGFCISLEFKVFTTTVSVDACFTQLSEYARNIFEANGYPVIRAYKNGGNDISFILDIGAGYTQNGIINCIADFSGVTDRDDYWYWEFEQLGYTSVQSNWGTEMTGSPFSISKDNTAYYAVTAGNASTVNGHSVGKDVPSNAVFTDTDTKVTSAANHYSPSRDSSADKSASASGGSAAWSMDVVKGVTLQTDGKGHVTGINVSSGKVPANPFDPSGTYSSMTVGNASKVNNHTVDKDVPSNAVFTDTTYSDATTSASGLMSASDKSKLNGIANNANNYTHPTSSGNKHIPSGGSSGKILRWSADGTATWGDETVRVAGAGINIFNGAISADIRSVTQGGSGSDAKIYINGGSVDGSSFTVEYANYAGNANYATGASNYTTGGNIASRFNAIDSNIASLQTSTSGNSAVVKLTGSGWSIQGEVSVYNGSGRYSYTSSESANTLWLKVLNYKVRSILLVGDCTGNSTSKFVLSALDIGNTILVAVMNRSSSGLTLSFRYNADGNTQFTLFIPSTGASTKTDYGISIPSKECKTFVLSRVEATYFMLKEL